MSSKEEARVFIRKKYAAVAQNGSQGGCCGGGCSCSGDSLDINRNNHEYWLRCRRPCQCPLASK